MLGIGLALAASLSWGLSDYLGGVKSRIVPLLTLIAVSQLAGLALIGVITGTTSSFPDGRTAAYGAIAGAAGVAAVAAFYRGMAIGRISIVAPVSATGAVIPVVVGLARGERPGSLALVGMALAFVGVVLASAEDEPGGTRSLAAGVPLALVAAFGFGIFFLFVAKASEGDHALSAAFMLRLTTVPLILLAMLALRQPFRVPRGNLHWLVLIGALDSGANTLFALATNHGLLSLVSVLGSLYPLSTVLLAQALLREHVARHQKFGIAAALAGVALISI
ncbi:MAG: DMT family transporter [Gaiellaceae bacterium]